jgi:hypothetical protein
VGRFFGDRVEIYYPFVSTAKEPHFGLFEDLTLHDRIFENLRIYLSRGADEESKLISEKALRKISLENLMSVEQQLLSEALDSESIFVINTLAQFPGLFENLSADQLNLINTILKNGNLGKISSEELPDEKRQMCIDYMSNLKQAKTNIVILLLKAWIQSNHKLSRKLQNSKTKHY